MVVGKMIINMDMVRLFSLTEINIKVIGLTIRDKAKENWFILMEQSMKVNLKMTILTAMEKFIILQEIGMKVNGKKE